SGANVMPGGARDWRGVQWPRAALSCPASSRWECSFDCQFSRAPFATAHEKSEHYASFGGAVLVLDFVLDRRPRRVSTRANSITSTITDYGEIGSVGMNRTFWQRCAQSLDSLRRETAA